MFLVDVFLDDGVCPYRAVFVRFEGVVVAADDFHVFVEAGAEVADGVEIFGFSALGVFEVRLAKCEHFVAVDFSVAACVDAPFVDVVGVAFLLYAVVELFD